MRGKVYLVGVGPGDPELLTIKALNIIKSVDVVMYDRLVCDEILNLIPESTMKLFSGKDHSGNSEMQQDEINHNMARFAIHGLSVARLKSGDPFLFGRGAEEIEYLKGVGIECEIIPGLTSAIGIPTSIGLPLTHRNYSSQILIISGHLKNGNSQKWENIAEFSGTIVILMGANSVGDISEKLIKYGKSPETPVCIIQNGTQKTQRIITDNLRNITAKSRSEGLQPPALIVIGEVVKLRNHIQIKLEQARERV